MSFDVQVVYSLGRGCNTWSSQTQKPNGLGNPTPTNSTTDFDCQTSL